MMTQAPLDRELAYFDQQRRALLSQGHAGKWACIHGEKLLGLYDTDGEAFGAGVGALGAHTSFLVKQVLDQEDPPAMSSLCLGVLGAIP